MISVSNRDLHWGKWQPLHYILHLPPALSHSMPTYAGWELMIFTVPQCLAAPQIYKPSKHNISTWGGSRAYMCNKSSIVQHCYSSIKLSAVGKEQVELWNIQDCCCLQKALGSKLPAHQHGQTVHNWLKIINSAKVKYTLYLFCIFNQTAEFSLISDSSADSATENYSQDFIQLKASQNRKIPETLSH